MHHLIPDKFNRTNPRLFNSYQLHTITKRKNRLNYIFIVNSIYKLSSDIKFVRIFRTRLKKKNLGAIWPLSCRFGCQHKFFGRQKFSALRAKDFYFKISFDTVELLACEYSHLSFALATTCETRRQTSAIHRQKFHTDDVDLPVLKWHN